MHLCMHTWMHKLDNDIARLRLYSKKFSSCIFTSSRPAVWWFMRHFCCSSIYITRKKRNKMIKNKRFKHSSQQKFFFLKKTTNTRIESPTKKKISSFFIALLSVFPPKTTYKDESNRKKAIFYGIHLDWRHCPRFSRTFFCCFTVHFTFNWKCISSLLFHPIIRSSTNRTKTRVIFGVILYILFVVREKYTTNIFFTSYFPSFFIICRIIPIHSFPCSPCWMCVFIKLYNIMYNEG